jgi:hypothetical protein
VVEQTLSLAPADWVQGSRLSCTIYTRPSSLGGVIKRTSTRAGKKSVIIGKLH